jgi:hypothetical protein
MAIWKLHRLGWRADRVLLDVQPSQVLFPGNPRHRQFYRTTQICDRGKESHYGGSVVKVVAHSAIQPRQIVPGVGVDLYFGDFALFREEECFSDGPEFCDVVATTFLGLLNKSDSGLIGNDDSHCALFNLALVVSASTIGKECHVGIYTCQ